MSAESQSDHDFISSKFYLTQFGTSHASLPEKDAERNSKSPVARMQWNTVLENFLYLSPGPHDAKIANHGQMSWKPKAMQCQKFGCHPKYTKKKDCLFGFAVI